MWEKEVSEKKFPDILFNLTDVRFFLFFLFCTAILCSWAFYMCCCAVLSLIETHNVLNLAFKDPNTGAVHKASPVLIFQFLMFYGGTVVPIAFFCLIIALVMFAFLGYHLFLVARNTTTNETYKRDDYVRAVRAYLRKVDELKAESKNTLKESDQQLVKRNKKNQNAKNQQESLDEREVAALFARQLGPQPFYERDKNGKVLARNVYQRGIFKNFSEIIDTPFGIFS